MVPQKPRITAIAIPSAIALVFLISTFYLLKQLYSPSDPRGVEKIVTIPKGVGVVGIGKLLKEEEIIRDRHTFLLLAVLKGQARNLKSGEYQLSQAMSISELLQLLEEGKVYYRRVTVPEGYTLREIAAALERRGLVTAQEFMAEATDPKLISKFKIGAKSLEGYLFPDTYFFTSGTSAEEIVEKMLSVLKRNYTSPLLQRGKELRMDMHQVLTLASIIEAEARKEEERPIISGVFHNRLRRGMPLQADPTVRYALDGYRGPISRRLLKTKSPYNTYLNRGLPPGPISNPGLPSIKAALYPAKTPYLYFVAREDGTHKFSTTFREHSRAVLSLREKLDGAGKGDVNSN